MKNAYSALIVILYATFLVGAVSGCRGGGGGDSTSDHPPSPPSPQGGIGPQVHGNPNPIVAETGAAIKVSWQSPTQKSDGSALASSEIKGYRLYIIKNDGSPAATIPINDPMATSTTYSPVTPGVYTAHVTCVDKNNGESVPSTAVLLNISAP